MKDSSVVEGHLEACTVSPRVWISDLKRSLGNAQNTWRFSSATPSMQVHYRLSFEGTTQMHSILPTKRTEHPHSVHCSGPSKRLTSSASKLHLADNQSAKRTCQLASTNTNKSSMTRFRVYINGTLKRRTLLGARAGKAVSTFPPRQIFRKNSGSGTTSGCLSGP